MQKFLFILLSSIFITNSAGYSEEKTSNISVPIRINLKAVENKINAELPQRLAEINEPGRLCVPAKWLKTKGIPKCSMKGIKIYCKDTWIKIKTTPDIHCDVNGWVNRNGNVGLSGSGQTLQISVPIASSVSAKAAGISETADAKATIFATITPDITPEWNVSAVVTPDMRWDQRPTLKLFGIIKITIGSKVEPKLREKMNEFAATVPQMLSDLKIRSKVEEAWVNIQAPIQISKSPATYLIFRPRSVGFSGISIENNIMNAQVSIAGSTEVVIGDKPDIEPVPLQPLQKIPQSDGVFSFSVPTFVTFDEIERTAKSQFPDGFSTELDDEKLNGTLLINNLKAGRLQDGKLSLTIDVDYDNRSNFVRWIDIFDWFDTTGKITFAAVPRIDAEKDVVFVDGLEVDSDTNNNLVDALVDISRLPILRKFISDAAKYNYSGDLQQGISTANEAMNVQLEDGIRITGTLTAADMEQISVLENGLSMSATAGGTVSIDVGL
ncbi:uncharacterized protein DUF4403 [Roseibium marinum]|uniref:Uncharacterized protein DUF4403 n=2 Tax=Roseibium marinum TaxID=281252 RepID=A0A2S3UJM2_9HYPH|nr:uncharacterized protein DUF4403 [Roseibium marinum]